MTPLSERVHVSPRFRRSIRIDTDLSDPAALEGFICPESSASVLRTMALHVKESGQAAFTWTGPYGVGKSSLVVALSAVLNAKAEVRTKASHILGSATTQAIWEALPPKNKGWRVLPVVGRRDRPAQVVGEAIERARLVRGRRTEPWTDEAVFDALVTVSKRESRTKGGLMVFIDEMGKFLEGAAYYGTDIYFFQQLAEIASRSDGRLIVIGILHQAFEEYAYRLSRDMRDEWSKVQGRFVDLAINVDPEEQLGLLGRAIRISGDYETTDQLAVQVANLLHRDLPPHLLKECWPLHPITACLLGPISRRRFGQNQRSLFSFLNSTEPSGFQDFLRTAAVGDVYTPDMVWDYLRVNLEPSIVASPDGHRWAMAVDALERCQAAGGSDLKVRLLKVIALVDLFKERSGLAASLELLALATLSSEDEIRRALARLDEASIVIFRKFSNSYSIFEGSDFDIEHAVDEAYDSIEEVDFSRLSELAGLQPIVAKRHYHKTGAIRWFDMSIAPLREIEEVVAKYTPKNRSVGAFILALPSQGDSPQTVEGIVGQLRRQQRSGVILGIPQWTTWTIDSLARELLALEQVRDNSPELRGDRVARMEVESRIADMQGRIESDLLMALAGAKWQGSGIEPQRLDQAQLNGLASDIADSRFDKSPRLRNELLNRLKPSSNAVAAQNALLRRMVLHEGEERLGITGFPAEGGLFVSLLESTWLYRHTFEGWRFVAPTAENDPCYLLPAWQTATKFLESQSHRSVSVTEIYDIWREAPFGIKDGLMPVIAVAFALSRRDNLAFYRQGIFQVRMTDLDTDYLTRDPSDIQFRWMDLSDVSRGLLSEMAGVVRHLDDSNALPDLEPIDVARGLVAIYDALPLWSERTQQLSGNAKRVRQLFKQAKDPNRLIFDDIPQAFGDQHDKDGAESVVEIAQRIQDGLMELQQAYPSMLRRLKETLLTELGVSNFSAESLSELRSRADTIKQLSGDHRLEAFVLRISQFGGTDDDMESLASMAANKPPRLWTDSDIDRAIIELADMARSFVRHEAYAHVKGRQDRRHAIAVVVGLDGRPIHDTFEVTDQEQEKVDKLITRVRNVLSESGEGEQNIILAALARVSAEYLEARTDQRIETTEEAAS